MKYTLIHRQKSTLADSPAGFVTWMRRHDLQDFRSNAEFMAAYTQRKSTFEKITLRADSEEAFVEDLVKNGLLKVEDKKERGIFGLFSKK